MNNRIASVATLVPVLASLALPAVPARAQEEAEGQMTAEMAAMMEAYEEAGTPGAIHEALARTAGTWTVTVKMWAGPGTEPTVSEATSVIEPIMGGRFLRETVEGEFMGRPFHGVSIVGVNNTTGEAEGVWYDDHSTALYMYRGSVDDAADEMTLESEYTDPATGERVKTRNVRSIRGDRMVDTAWETRDGEERKAMELVYRRKG